MLTGGEDIDIDVGDLQKHTKYSGGYSKSSSTVGLFWKVLGSLNAEERSAFLKFVTSCSRPPLGGFKHLQPPLTLHKVDLRGELHVALNKSFTRTKICWFCCVSLFYDF